MSLDSIDFHLRRLREMVKDCPVKNCESCWSESIEIRELEKLAASGQTHIDYGSWFESVIKPILDRSRNIN